MANLCLDEGGDMVQHLHSYMELVVRTEWRQLPKDERTFLQLVRVYNEENDSQKHTAERSANAMAMAAASQHLHIAIKGVANKARSGKSSSSGGKKKSSSSPSSSQATSGSSKGKGNSNGNSKRLLCYGCGARDHEGLDCPVASHLLPGNGTICWTCHKQGHVKSESLKSISSSGKAAAALESFPDAAEMLAAMFEPSVLAASTTSTMTPFMIDSGRTVWDGWGVHNETTGMIVFSRNVSFGPKLSSKVTELSEPPNIVQLDVEPGDPGFLDPAVADRPQGIRRLPARAGRGQRSSAFRDTYAAFMQESEGFLCKIALVDDDPTSYGDAMSSPERQQWAKAFEAELGYLIKNETLEEVVLPHGAKVVSTKQRSAWVWVS
ncbi:unnamed protein product [Tilletia controversa]|nr:unnamed protein product [Tilletia controversa]